MDMAALRSELESAGWDVTGDQEESELAARLEHPPTPGVWALALDRSGRFRFTATRLTRAPEGERLQRAGREYRLLREAQHILAVTGHLLQEADLAEVLLDLEHLAREDVNAEKKEDEGASRPSRARPLLLVLLVSLVWLVAGGLALLLWRQPQPVAFQVQPPPATATPLPTPTPAGLVIDVDGAVRQPGAYELPAGSRVQQAIEAAGGATTEADLRTLSLTQMLSDGAKVYVPAEGEAIPAAVVAERAPVTVNVEEGGVFPINVNTANEEALQALPGIGPVTAQAIVAHRQANGPFTSIESITDVRGIGEATLARIRDLITVE